MEAKTEGLQAFDPGQRFSPLEPLQVALAMSMRGLSANRIRSLLTMLGVIIGVGAVIVAIGIGEGSRQSVMERVEQLGTNVLTIRPGSRNRGGVGFGIGSSQTLTPEDAEALKAAPAVASVSAQVRNSLQVKYGNRNSRVPINGADVDFPKISNHPVDKGRFFTSAEVNGKKRVAVLGSETYTELFDQVSALNKTIRISGQTFLVVGVLTSKGGMGFRNPDDSVYIPYTTAMSRLMGVRSLDTITVQARSFGEMALAQQQIEGILGARHGGADFRVFNQADLAEMQTAQQDTFASLITALAVVSLLVGGIGIMNIMLVSVTERTREIGIRKAIGARRRDILYQFILEALFLALAGGLLGTLAGVSGSSLIAQMNEWEVTVNAMAIVLAFSFSALVGVFFGFYPALKASQMRPVEALRYE